MHLRLLQARYVAYMSMSAPVALSTYNFLSTPQFVRGFLIGILSFLSRQSGFPLGRLGFIVPIASLEMSGMHTVSLQRIVRRIMVRSCISELRWGVISTVLSRC